MNNVALHVSLVSPAERADGERRGHSGYSAAQFRSLASQIALWQAAFSIPASAVVSHQEVDRSGTRRDPRSFDWERLGQELRSRWLACGVPAYSAEDPTLSRLRRDAMGLHLLLDSADPCDWQQWLPSGLFRGVTCNPTLLRRASQPCTLAGLTELSRRALDLGAGEIHLQAWGADAEALRRCGLELAALAAGRVLVKLPVTRAGALAARRLIAEAVPITFTACYQVPQVLVAAALGARFIAPYLGRISDQGRDGVAELLAMQAALDGVGSATRLLVASLRQSEDLGRLAAAGLDCFTLSPSIAAALFACEATEVAALRFEQDATGA